MDSLIERTKNATEIIIATENNDMICKIENLSQIDTLFVAQDKFKVSASILDVNGEKIIMAM